MSSAKASGNDTGNGNAGARSREHNQGNQDRKSTPEQQAAVIRIRKCKVTAFYEILDLEAVRTSCSDSDIKKAYRKQSLLTHPDKNGYEHADEAFKMVSKAFSVLGDKEKRERFDRFGTDPESRFESARAQAQNPFSSGGRAAGGQATGFGRGGLFDDEISPEEMFMRFFGGGLGGGFGGGGFGGPFGGDMGPQFVFNVGGGNRGFRVHQFGGAGPRTRPRADGQPGEERQPTGRDRLLNLLPILFLFVLPLLSSLFSGLFSSQPKVPSMVFDTPKAPYTYLRTTPNYRVHYYVNPNDVAGWEPYHLQQLDHEAELGFVRHLRLNCESELRTKQVLLDNAQGWIYTDPAKLKIAQDYDMASCKRMSAMGLTR